MQQKARIKLTCTEIAKINQTCSYILEIAEKTGVSMKGPIPLPTRKIKVTTRKCTAGRGKASFDNFEMRLHKRLIDIGLEERALRMIMRVPIPEGLNIEIEMI